MRVFRRSISRHAIFAFGMRVFIAFDVLHYMSINRVLISEVPTLACDSAVEGIAFDEYRLSCTPTMGFQDIHCLDGILDLATRVHSLNGKHSVHGHRREKIVITVKEKLSDPSST